MIRHRHAHTYVYRYILDNNTEYGGTSVHEYKLLTDITGHKKAANRKALEAGLRAAYGYWPKGVRFSHSDVTNIH